MNRSMLIGTVVGAVVATTAGSIAGYKMMTKEVFAEVVSVTPVTEQVKTPREECQDVTVTKQEPVKDEHRIAGTVVGALAGGVLGDVVGGGGKNTGAKIVGAAAGGLAGNKVQQKMQQNDTYTTTERRCNTVVDVSERTVGYRVKYTLDGAPGEITLAHDPGARIPVRDGQLVIAEAQTVPLQGAPVRAP